MRALVAVGVAEAEARARVAGQYDAAEGGTRGAAGTFAVLPCNWEAVEVFVEMPAAVWDMPPLGGRARGLRRDQVTHELVLRGIGRRRWPGLWQRLRAMERAALGVWAR